MSSDNNPLLVIIAGPNGSGKSTFQKSQESLKHIPFVNADNIAKSLFKDIGKEESQKAQNIAQKQIENFIKEKQSFCFETVFSHPSKIDLIKRAKENGYTVELVIISTENPNINIIRVKNRFKKGGHDVPTDKIKERYPRTLKNLSEAVLFVDSFEIIDSSNQDFVHLAKKPHNSSELSIFSELPDWTKDIITSFKSKTDNKENDDNKGNESAAFTIVYKEKTKKVKKNNGECGRTTQKGTSCQRRGHCPYHG